MLQVNLGHWHYLVWHLPSVLFALVATALVYAMSRSLARDALAPAVRAQRWQILGWSAMAAGLMAGVAWPYLTAAARLNVAPDGSWHLTNYLGVPVANIPADEARSLRGIDLGGVGVGTGRLEVRRADGSVVRSVRISRSELDAAYTSLGYPRGMIHDAYGDTSVELHRYGPAGPRR